jgi:hypothetical protein
MNVVNHVGWNVEVLTTDGRGWIVQVGPFPKREDAELALLVHAETLPHEFRVYEALK